MADYLYIHIPFCIRKCLYCDFFSVPYNEELARQYVGALCRELEIRRDSAGVLQTVYFGGGTPSLLPEEIAGSLLTRLRDVFALSFDAEITMEANPGTLSRAFIEPLLPSGLNRISLGVQSFDDRELRTLGRIHTSARARRAVDIIKAAGLRNWSLDLMYGIPGQTVETWGKTLSLAVGLSPTHISAYELTPEAGTPIYAELRRGMISLPGEESILSMYDLAADTLEAAGYRHYEISNYALPGFECRHNINYWDRGEYIGAGAGSHSFTGGIRSRNTASISDYIRLLSEGTLPVEESATVTATDAAKELLFLGLRKTEGIGISDGADYGLNLRESSLQLIADGYLEIDGDYLKLTRKGLVLSNAVIVKLFEESGL